MILTQIFQKFCAQAQNSFLGAQERWEGRLLELSTLVQECPVDFCLCQLCPYCDRESLMDCPCIVQSSPRRLPTV